MHDLDRRYLAAAAVPHTLRKGTTAMHTTPEPAPQAASADQVADTLAQATTAADIVHGLARAGLGQTAIPAPELIPILVQLEELDHGLDQLLRQLAVALFASWTVYDLREDDPDDRPATTVARAVEQLDDAATFAYRAGRALDGARNAIAGQSYQPRPHSDRAEATR